MIAVGLMSGTSLDGIDAALVRILPAGPTYDLELLEFRTVAYDSSIAAALRCILPPNAGTVAALAGLHSAIGRAFGGAARAVLGSHRIDYVASHGQSVYHDGAQSITLQIGDAFVIREAIGASVCYDFRSADCAVGGHGAPLVPYVDRLLLQSSSEERIALNIGGIANFTHLPTDGNLSACDTGPGNMLIDAFVRERTGGAMTFDRDGRLAAHGNVDKEVLAAMLADPYFAKPAPKSAGREQFGSQFLAEYELQLGALTTEDGAATLAALTACSIADAVRSVSKPGAHIIVSGGGVHNRELLRRLEERLSGYRVEPSTAMGISVDGKEALAFAVLGYETLRGRTANLTGATGASRAVPLGAIAPFELAGLLAKVERECAG
ncbi:MAG: anhydro-N-acetylmuramic acid kinase [Candidatus Baltobacteraceae bacterium]